MKTISTILFFVILLFFNFAFADLASDAEKLFNSGEQKYPRYFATGQTEIATQVIDYKGYKWYYRYYPQTNIYLITNKLNKVYVLGGVFGKNLLYVGMLPDFLNEGADVTPPVITLSGNNSVSVNQGENYTDAGATATDDVDSSVDVIISGSVDTSKVDTYTIRYTATDKAGNKATATRTVNVVSSEMKGIVLSLSEPTDSITNLIPGLSATINANITYTGNENLSYTLVENPDGMTIDINSGLISWIPPESAGGNNYSVKAKVTDGILFSEVSFNVVVVDVVPLQKIVQDDTLSVTEDTNSLNGLSLKALSSELDLNLVNLNIIKDNFVPTIPAYINKLTNIFSVTPAGNGNIQVRFPKSLLPSNASIFDLKLFHYATNMKGVDDSWVSLGTDFDLEGDSENPIVVITIHNMEGIYFIGIQESTPASSIHESVRKLKKASLPDITCTPFQKTFSNGIIITTYKIQYCEVSGTNKKFKIEGFANQKDTASGTHWGSVTIKYFVVWLTETQDKFDTLDLKYKSSFDVIIETRNNYGAYDGSKLHINSAYTKEDQRNTTAHEYFHHAEIETLIDGSSNAIARNNRYKKNNGDWIWEGMAYWFEDYFDDNSNLYPSDGVAYNPSPRILEKGINKYTYDMFFLWKLLDTKCGYGKSSDLKLSDIFSGVMDKTWGANTLKATLSKSSSCNFGSHLGAAKKSNLEAALLYYQYATLYENKISLLDNNEDDKKFKFEPPQTLKLKSDNKKIDIKKEIKGIKTIPAYGAYSFKIDSNIWNNGASNRRVALHITTTDKSQPLIISIIGNATNDNKNDGDLAFFVRGGYTGFIDTSKINGKRHYHYKTKDITRYSFPKKTSGEFFVTLLNHNDTDVSLDKAYVDVSNLLLKSGTWTVPKTGNYEVYGIAAGGSAKFVYSNPPHMWSHSQFIAAYGGGGGGAFKEKRHLTKGQKIPYTVGSGTSGAYCQPSSGAWNTIPCTSSGQGGNTTFLSWVANGGQNAHGPDDIAKGGKGSASNGGNGGGDGIAATTGGMWAGDGGIAYISNQNGKISKSSIGEDSLAQSGFGKGENGYNSGSSIMPKNYGTGSNGVIKITYLDN
jgi:hypothetical protein